MLMAFGEPDVLGRMAQRWFADRRRIGHRPRPVPRVPIGLVALGQTALWCVRVTELPVAAALVALVQAAALVVPLVPQVRVDQVDQNRVTARSESHRDNGPALGIS